MNTTLPTDSQARKEVPIVSGCLDYFPAALAGVARISYAGNQKHNPGQPLHHARGKSTDHADCIVRHLVDVQGLLAEYDRQDHDATEFSLHGPDHILAEASALAWRALALSQELHERFGAPLAPGARLPAAPVPGAHEAVYDGASADPVSPVAPTFRIEVGKRYVRRDGSVSGVLEKTGHRKYPLRDDRDSYLPDGRCNDWGDQQPGDLVAEYVGPESGD